MAEPARKYDRLDDPYNPANLRVVHPGDTAADFEPAQHDEGDTGVASRPVLRAINGGGETSAPTGNLRSVKDGDTASGSSGGALNDEQLAQREQGDGKGAATTAEKAEQSALKKSDDQVGKGYTGDGDENDGRLRRFARNSRRWVAVAAGGGLLAAGGFGIFGISSGPIAAMQASKILQAAHFAPSEDTGDMAEARVLYYAMMGNAAKGRLGFVRDKVADKVELKVNESGLQSVYAQSGRNRLIGYAVLDEGKAKPFLDDMKRDGVPMSDTMTGQDIHGKPVATNGTYVDMRDERFSTRRSVTKTIVKSAKVKASPIAARLLIKRGGVSFHVIGNWVREKTDNWADRKNREKEKRAKEEALGSQSPEVRAAQADPNTDADGNANPDPDAVQASEDAQSAIDQTQDIDQTTVEGKQSLDSLKNILAKSGGPMLAIGLACTAQQFGDRAAELQHDQYVKVGMRMGVGTMSGGQQVQAMHSISTDGLAVHNDKFYDPKTKTSWFGAMPVLAWLGKANAGVDADADAKAAFAGEKPTIFAVFTDVPLLRGVCTVVDTVGNLPVLKQINDLSGAAIDTALAPFGTSTQGLIDSALKMMMPVGLNLFAQGAEAGWQDMYGARAAANDAARATGGIDLTTEQEGALAMRTRAYAREDLARASFYDRYLDPYSIDSAAGRMAMAMPTSYPQLMNQITRLPTTFSSTLGSVFFKRTLAWTPVDYDYGFAMVGFSVERQNSESFLDPYTNAQQNVEPRLAELNEEWGPCFTNTVNPDTGDFITGASIPDAQRPERCRTEADNPDYIHYGNYLQAKAAEFALGCRYDDADSCRNLGFVPTQAQAGTQAVSATGSAEDLARQILNLEKTGKISFTTPLAKQAIQDTAQGKEASIESRCADTSGGKTSASLSPELLQVIVTITNSHTLGIGYLTNGCHSSGSTHYSGKALDINLVDGRSSTGGDADRAFMQELTGILPDGSSMGERQCSNTAITPINSVTLMDDTCNHIHVNVP